MCVCLSSSLTHKQSLSLSLSFSLSLSHSLSHTQTHTHTCTHFLTHSHTHAHTHTHQYHHQHQHFFTEISMPTTISTHQISHIRTCRCKYVVVHLRTEVGQLSSDEICAHQGSYRDTIQGMSMGMKLRIRIRIKREDNKRTG